MYKTYYRINIMSIANINKQSYENNQNSPQKVILWARKQKTLPHTSTRRSTGEQTDLNVYGYQDIRISERDKYILLSLQVDI